MVPETMSFLSWVHREADVQKTEYNNDRVEVTFEATREIAERTKKRVEQLNGEFETVKPEQTT